MTEDANKKGTILIVDDESDVVFFISKVCQPEGYATITAGSGIEALKYIDELGEKIDLVLLDLRMPGMGGIEVLKSIRKRHNKIPVIVLTALTDKREECEKLDIETYITKPYSLEDLYHHITAVMERKAGDKSQAVLPSGQIPSAKILVVDDEKEVCEILNEYLSHDIPDVKFEVRHCLNGDEALQIANEFEPDIAIVDIKMPHMWGDESIERFKRGEAFCPKDYVVFTSADVPQQRRKAARAGHSYLTKPGLMGELDEILKKICIRHNLLVKR